MSFLHSSSFLTNSSPGFTFLSLKQSIIFSKYYSLNRSSNLEVLSAFFASFRKIIRGRLLPKAISMSSTPNAITSASSATRIVSLRKHPLERLVYSSKDSPLVIVPLNSLPLYLVSFPDFKIYIEAANSPSLHIYFPFSKR